MSISFVFLGLLLSCVPSLMGMYADDDTGNYKRSGSKEVGGKKSTIYQTDQTRVLVIAPYNSSSLGESEQERGEPVSRASSTSSAPVSVYYRDEKEHEIVREMTKLGIRDGKDDEPEDSEHESDIEDIVGFGDGNDASFATMKALFGAISNVKLDEIKDFEKTQRLKTVVNGFVENSKKLAVQERDTLQFFFSTHPLLHKIGTCSFLWIAVEYALKSKKDNEPKNIYQRRLEIVRILARVASDTLERRPIRNSNPPRWYSWFCLPCCGPCISALCIVEGGLQHRAAQANNVDVLKILLDNWFCIEGKDGDGWTPYMYATWFKSTDVERFLLGAGAQKKNITCACCFE